MSLYSKCYFLDSFLNECCFKGSSMGLKIHTNSKTTPRCLGHQGVTTPQCPMYQGVATPRCPLHPGVAKFDPLKIQKRPKYQGFATPRCLKHWGVSTPRCPKHRGVVLLFVWTFKPMALPLKKHLFRKLSKSNIYYTSTFDLSLINFPSPRI